MASPFARVLAGSFDELPARAIVQQGVAMRNISLVLSLLGAMLVISLPGTPAQAQLFRTWVSGTGSDANSCDRTAPCATLAGAETKTSAGGEIAVLDPGSFGDLIITQAITIVNEGATAFDVDLRIAAGASDVVTLRGLKIRGLDGFPAITFTSGAALHVENCQLTSGTGGGIDFEPSGASQLFVSDTIVRDNTTGTAQGIRIRPTGAGTANVVLERVQVTNNGAGIVATAGGSSGTGTVVNMAVRDSVASGNSGVGILAKSQVSGPNVIMTLDHVAATSNGVGIEADGSDMGAGGIALSNTQVSGNGTGLMSANGGVLASFQNNSVIGNGTDGAPTTTVAPK
jgi:hypothetical protein